ncbi:MAG: NADH-quinone oxidoreductase subunit L [Deltaproteobacteria bacterium]|jgi:NADH-quinone oxidoreductase subunit L|nr:NADH-quinone oxidoreductase subunit L [Deltaproteobacteria bacterium]
MMSMLSTFATQILLAAEEGKEIEPGITEGPIVEFAWLIVIVPIVMTFVILFFGKRSPFKGWLMAWLAMGFVIVYGMVLQVLNWTEGVTYYHQSEVAQIGDFAIEWGMAVDGLSIMMYFLVGVVGFLVFTYAKGYMEGDERFTWFFVSFTLFAGGMLVLVASPNLIQLIVGWELVGVASYLLIGHYWQDLENVDSANKAFMVNKVADAALFLGAIVMAVSVGSFRFNDIIAVVVEGEAGMLSQYAFWAGLLVFIGAMGKSAQFPLHVWLPDAMAGPTPVSALMHAATMVTAGIYLVARLFPFYLDLDQMFGWEVRDVIIVIGGLTLFLMGFLAIVQKDIKKVLAYSTVSQLGYMMAAMGAGAYTAGLFHLFTHAFFKALLFLGAGSVIHAVHSNDMDDMGGLRKYMPTTFWTFIIGTLALIGIFPLSGFFSKDEIIASMRYAGSHGQEIANVIMVLAIAGAFVTAFYMTRTVALTFFGDYKGDAHPHESPSIMTLPLVGLAFFAVTAGWLNIPGIFTPFTDWVATRFPLSGIGDHHPETFDWPLIAIVTPLALLGIAVGWWLYGKDAETQAARDSFRIPVLWQLFQHLYYIDEFYMRAIVRPIMGPVAAGVLWIDQRVVDGVVNGAGALSMVLARFTRRTDEYVVDGAYNALGAGTEATGAVLRRNFTGRVQQYAAFAFLGVVVIAVVFIIL